MNDAIALLKSTFVAWNEDKAPRLAAAIAFAAIFSIAPLLIITIAIVGGVLGFGHSAHPHSQVENGLIAHVRAGAGTQAAAVVRGMIDASFHKARTGIFAQVLGWIMFVVGATGIFAALQDALNTVWHVEPAKRSLWETVREKSATVAMLLVIGLLLIVSSIASAALAYISNNLAPALPFPGAGIAFTAIDWIVSIAVVTLLFALIYKFLPEAEVAFRDVWIGAALSAVLFVIGQSLIAWYLGVSGTASAYGAAGALLALLLWIYYSAMLLLFGAEFTRVYSAARGHAIHAFEPSSATRRAAS